MSKDISKYENRENGKYVIPPVDITETEENFLLTADIPGVKKDDIEITIDNEMLELRGKVQKAADNLEKNIKYAEYKEYDFYRQFNIGNNINSEKVEAKVENGVLSLTLPKKEELKPKKIDISVN